MVSLFEGRILGNPKNGIPQNGPKRQIGSRFLFGNKMAEETAILERLGKIPFLGFLQKSKLFLKNWDSF